MAKKAAAARAAARAAKTAATTKAPAKTKETAAYPWAYHAAFWSLVALLLFPPFFRGLFFPFEQELALMGAATVCWLAWLYKHEQRDYRFLSHPLDYFTLLLPLAYLLAAFGAVNTGLALDEVTKNLLYFLAYWTAAQLVRDERTAAQLLHAVYLAALGVALAGLFTATGIIYIKDGFLGGRIYSSFQYPNALASYLALAAFLGLFFWAEYGDRAVKEGIRERALLKALPRRILDLRPYGYLYAPANFLLLAVLFGTKSRGGLLITGAVFILYVIGLSWEKRLPVVLHALVVGGLGYLSVHKFILAAEAKQYGLAWLWVLGGLVLSLVWQWLYAFLSARCLNTWLVDKKRSALLLLSLMLGGLIAFAAVLATHPQVLQKVFSFAYLRNAFERTYFIKDALAMFKARPLLGWGGGGWEEAYRAYQGYLYNSNEVHSHYFQVAVETGMVGLLAILGIWVCFLLTAHRAYWAAPAGSLRRALVWSLTAGALAVGLHAAVDFDLSLSALTLALWVSFACVRNLAPGQHDVPGKAERRSPRPAVLAGASAACALIFAFAFLLASANSYAQTAAEHFRQEKFAEGLSALQKAAAYNPFNADLHTNLVRAYLSAGQVGPALEEAKRAVELSQYSAARRADLARAYLAAGDYRPAVEEARRAVELAPWQIRWYENLALVLAATGHGELEAGNKEAARQYLEEALKVPQAIEAKVAALGEEEKRLWKDSPMLSVTPGVQLGVGQAQYLLGRFAEAEKSLSTALQEEQLKGEATLWLALVKEKQGRSEEAQKFLQEAEKTNREAKAIFAKLQKIPTLP
ncbi:tetratricopeptide repeat protein [Desulfovirgula thermocuniculi]|uniref:tetratricopeptide repeat protein n=1 Tax=Desulfovirgula thermocuniculi TaxID=348842 RepID=UPI00041BDAA0|nr:tetratricopeptide repeat protein [Desulfovirgula thermocuniculi]